LRYRTLRALGFLAFVILGFRSAPPQALCFRRASRLIAILQRLDQIFLKLIGLSSVHFADQSCKKSYLCSVDLHFLKSLTWKLSLPINIAFSRN
jgi:hypothetical protein